jgi:DNA-binding Lrp family transcriptional regulator
VENRSEKVSRMVIAFVLITTKPGSEKEIYSTLKGFNEIIELYPLFGEYDLIVRLEASDMDAIGKLVVEKIRSLDGVLETKTLTGVNF